MNAPSARVTEGVPINNTLSLSMIIQSLCFDAQQGIRVFENSITLSSNFTSAACSAVARMSDSKEHTWLIPCHGETSCALLAVLCVPNVKHMHSMKREDRERH